MTGSGQPMRARRRADSRLRIVLVSDTPMLAHGLRVALDGVAGAVAVEVIDHAPGPDVALGAEPDLAVVARPRGAAEAVRALKHERPRVPIVAILDDPHPDELVAVIAGGAAAAVSAAIGPPDLGAIVERVLAGEYLVNDVLLERPEVAARVLGTFHGLAVYGEGAERYFASITPREMKILELIAGGLPNRAIAFRLAISEQTVKNHTSSILRKLAVNDRTQAAVHAIRAGWIPLDTLAATSGSEPAS